MKRLTLILGAAALTAISAPIQARAQTGCSWWDITCNGLGSGVSNTGWKVAGRDSYGNVIYVRRRVDSSGNVIVEQARRNSLGMYQIINTHTVRNGAVYNTSRTYNGHKYKAPKYKAPKSTVIHYDNDVKGAKPHEVNYHAAKAHGEQVPVGVLGGEQQRMEKTRGGNPHGEKGKGPKR
jgi:hypothetical protein